MSESEDFDLGDRIRLDTLSDIPYSAIKNCSPEEIDKVIIAAILSQCTGDIPVIKAEDPPYSSMVIPTLGGLKPNRTKEVSFEELKKKYGIS